jgi:hypothetical protein
MTFRSLQEHHGATCRAATAPDELRPFAFLIRADAPDKSHRAARLSERGTSINGSGSTIPERQHERSSPHLGTPRGRLA